VKNPGQGHQPCAVQYDMKDGGPSVRRSARVAGEPPAAETYHEQRLLRLLAMSRYSIGIAVVGTFVGASALLVHGVQETLALVGTVLAVWLPAAVNSAHPPPLLAAIAAVDAFLVAVVLYFIAAGLYQLDSTRGFSRSPARRHHILGVLASGRARHFPSAVHCTGAARPSGQGTTVNNAAIAPPTSAGRVIGHQDRCAETPSSGRNVFATNVRLPNHEVRSDLASGAERFGAPSAPGRVERRAAMRTAEAALTVSPGPRRKTSASPPHHRRQAAPGPDRR
jgi:Uncharacterized protein family, UPF0114